MHGLFLITDIFTTRVEFDMKRLKIFRETVNKKCNNARKGTKKT